MFKTPPPYGYLKYPPWYLRYQSHRYLRYPPIGMMCGGYYLGYQCVVWSFIVLGELGVWSFVCCVELFYCFVEGVLLLLLFCFVMFLLFCYFILFCFVFVFLLFCYFILFCFGLFCFWFVLFCFILLFCYFVILFVSDWEYWKCVLLKSAF